jgi:hypothetical protein
MFATFLPMLTRGRPPPEQVRLAFTALARGNSFGDAYTNAACEVGRDAARRLHLPDEVQHSIYHVYELWKDGGVPAGLAGAGTGCRRPHAHPRESAEHTRLRSAGGGEDHRAHPADDRRRQPGHLTAAHETVAALPDVRTVVLDGQQHIVHRRVPAAFAEDVVAFLRAVP